MSAREAPLLTLEPLIEAVRAGVESSGWEMSGLQKTTSHQFEGRWEGESTRSAYLFFHRPEGWENVGIDVYLDETRRGLAGTLSLVVDGPPLGAIGDPSEVLSRLGAAAAARLPRGYRSPISLRLKLPEPDTTPGSAEVEARFKARLPSAAVRSGASAVSDVVREVVRCFEGLLAHDELRDLLGLD